jgi:hypothetical protein
VNALIHTGVARIAVRANWGRFVLGCSRCPSATWVNPDADSLVVCRDCGTPAEAVWPSAEMVYGIERLLLMRPDVTTRNWEPGETLHDLMEENVAHGLVDGHALEPGGVFGVVGDSIITDRLPIVGPRVLKAVGA